MTHKWKQPHATSNRGLWYKHTGPHIYTDHGLWHGFTRTHILTNHGKLISFLDQTYPRIMVYAPSPDVKNFSLNNKIISTGDTFIIKRKIFNVSICGCMISWVHVPSDHGEGVVTGEEGASRDVGDGLFPCVDQIRVHLIGQWVGALSIEESSTDTVSQTFNSKLCETIWICGGQFSWIASVLQVCDITFFFGFTFKN